MKATNWEFTNRALVFGLIFGCAFPLYTVGHDNSTAVLANWLGARFQMDADRLAHILFAGAALQLVVAALIRTWASAYLQAEVVYAAEVKSQSLMADGPYRYVRNPLYAANVLMAVGMGSMMSRTGFLVAVVTMLVFCYRLINREEPNCKSARGKNTSFTAERSRACCRRFGRASRPRVDKPGGARDSRQSPGSGDFPWQCWSLP